MVVVQRVALAVLDGQGGDAGLDGLAHIAADASSIICKPGFEIGVDRQIGGGDEVAQIGDRLVDISRQVALSERERQAVTGGAGGDRTARPARPPPASDDYFSQ